MQDASSTETKKVVLRALTQVLQTSKLRGQLDPKAFLMMLHANYAAIHRSDGIHLGPVWDAVSPGHAPESLFGLFLRFAEVSAELGLSVTLPPAMATLDPHELEHYRTLFDTPAETAPMDARQAVVGEPESGEAALVLDSQHLRPFIPDELRRQVVQLVVQSMKGAPVGDRVEAAQLAYLLDSNFEDLFDGQSFDFGPVLGLLRQLEGFGDHEVYVGLVHLKQKLGEQGLALRPLALQLDAETAARLLSEAQQDETTGARGQPSPRKAPSADTSSEPEEGSAKERRLRRWGLLGFGRSRGAVLRLGAMLAVIVFGLIFAWFDRPNRPLDADDFDRALPMKRAELKYGAFNGVVDGERWWKLPVRDRQQKVEDLEQLLRSKGLLANAQVRDEKNRLVLSHSGTKLAAAAFFVKGNKDGSVPPGAIEPPKDLVPKKN